MPLFGLPSRWVHGSRLIVRMDASSAIERWDRRPRPDFLLRFG